MWRRVKLVPFLESFPIDRALSATLSAEGPGILRWCVEGCRDWQRDGLRHPAIVEAATEAYRAESDPLAQFYGACCTIGQGLQTGGRELFTAYCLWCNGQQMPTVERLSQRAFGTLVKSRFPDVGSRTVIYSGVALNPEIKAAATTCAPSGPKSLEELGLQEEGQVVTGDSLDDLPTCGPLC
jgi:putative DNA primase/helicase